MRRAAIQAPALPPVYIGIPAISWMYTKTVESLIWTIGELKGFAFQVEPGPSSIAHKRNLIVQSFLQHPNAPEYLVFLDSDMVFPKGMIPRLLGHHKDIVGVLYPQRLPPFKVIGGVGNISEWTSQNPGNGLQPVDVLGAGVLIVRRKVLAAIPRPWFSSELTPGSDSEDVYFCAKARDHGFDLWCDTDLEVGHMTFASITAEAAPRWREAMGT